jgi:hypothetical protein
MRDWKWVCEADVRLRWRKVMMLVMRSMVEWMSLVWKGKDIVAVGRGKKEEGRGVEREDEVRCGRLNERPTRRSLAAGFGWSGVYRLKRIQWYHLVPHCKETL